MPAWDRELRALVEMAQAEATKAHQRIEHLEDLLARKMAELSTVKKRLAAEPRRNRTALEVELAAAKRRIGRLEVQLAERDIEVRKMRSQRAASRARERI